MDEAEERKRMVDEQLIPRGIKDPSTIKSMLLVPRHHFVSPEHISFAYKDHPLPIQENQTISQPYIVALMTQAAAIKPTDKVLEIGTGSGYGAAVLSRIAKEVVTVERFEKLADQARKRFQDLGYTNIDTITADGIQGYKNKAPYQAILVTARTKNVPSEFINQLDVNGRLVIPIGDAYSQELLLLTKRPSGEIASKVLEHVSFVELVNSLT
ncbi:MAG: protein-L-isoaspartate(D-aspartate) O-methyltransferase [Parachlamydiales bacterium]|nr:protein-L-isoaspartate(D-aspartate) O-methyltransferase [Parachlamydiales bacterium]